MCPQTDDSDNPLRSASYYMTIIDDNYEHNEGTYFTVTKVTSELATLHTSNTYELDVGYPSNNYVMSFNVTADDSWQLLYNYSSQITN